MDFNFLFTGNTITFIIAFVVFGGWQIGKLANPTWFYPIDENQKKRVAEIITTVNVCIGVIAAIVITGFGLYTNFWDALTGVLAILGSGGLFDILKAYAVLK